MGKEKFSLKVWYNGEPDARLDTRIKVYAAPGIAWAQGYDFTEDTRDIAFDFDDPVSRDMAIMDLKSIEGIHIALREHIGLADL